jgi:hypothetical protein
MGTSEELKGSNILPWKVGIVDGQQSEQMSPGWLVLQSWKELCALTALLRLVRNGPPLDSRTDFPGARIHPTSAEAEPETGRRRRFSIALTDCI